MLSYTSTTRSCNGECVGSSPRRRDVALISDAGTPLLSDPGARLVRDAVEAGYSRCSRSWPLRGACGARSSGIASERFTFYGFLARKGREREEALREVSNLQHTAVLYESPNRVFATLEELSSAEAVHGGRWWPGS
jgi:16S rRNA (cytidine1402-2'-O)-methyltransferase